MKSLERLQTIPWQWLWSVGSTLEHSLDQVLAGAEAERVVDRTLRKGHFEAPVRQVVAQSIFGVGLWRRTLRLSPSDSSLQLLVRLARDLGGYAEASQALKVEASALPERISRADRFSLPDWLDAELDAALPVDQRDAAADALNLPAPIFLRAKGDRERLIAVLAEDAIDARPEALTTHGVEVTSPLPNLLGCAANAQALFEIQDQSSQRVGELLEVQPGQRVLDLCAGAGGKTLQLASLMGDRGELFATDIDPEKLERLRRRAERAGIGCVRIVAKPEGLFDRVLVDAPCSELGALRRGPDRRWRTDPSTFAAWPAVQLDLCERALTHLAPGGRAVYATCTFRHAENEGVAEALEARHPALHRRDTFSAWPHRERGDGFFAIAWEKR